MYGKSKDPDTRKLERAALLLMQDVEARIEKDVLTDSNYKKLAAYVGRHPPPTKKLYT